MTHFDRKAHGYDVQAIVRTAFPSLTHCRYLLLRIEDAEWARCWLHMLRHSGLVLSVNDVGARAGSIAEAVLVAFSHGGLVKLVEVDSRFPFPTAFTAGMASQARAPLLGDRDRSAWTWGDVAPDGAPGNFEVDVLVAHYRKDPFNDTQGLLRPATLRKYGLRAIKKVDTCPFYMADGSEPFGFKDGIAQPRIPGLRGDEAPEAKLLRKLMQRVTRGRRKSEDDDNAVAPGEFILGQVNAYGETAYCPDVVGFSEYEGKGGHFGQNGSYLAVRQIAQDVAAFRGFDKQYENAPAPTPVEKMVGRMKRGQPILAYPHPGADKGAFNTFGFRVEDYEGFHCPRGSHIRRGNPRDALGWDRESGVFASKLHRLIRRGRVYMNQAACGVPGAACKPIAQRDPCGKGLFFIALNADLDRQFEFVQQRWIENPKFADLWDETDPALGGAGRGFSMPGCAPIGTRLRSLPQFTTVTGGGYFFMPSLTALEFIAKGRSAPSMKTQNSDPRSQAAAQAWMDQPEIRERPAPPSGEFEIGLSLGGTVSAGAYSAGVLDFLVEALDEWEKAKGQSGVPKHMIRLRVLTGTSGGGACAATLAKALAYRFPPERIRFGEDPPHPDSVNPLYRLWVHQFDVHDLCDVSDDEKPPPLKSLLHEGPATYPFQDRPQNAVGESVVPMPPRPWVADPMALILTLTNLSGVPYSVPYTGQSGRGQTYRRHADYARFDFYYSNSPDVPGWPDAFAVRAHREAVLPACQPLPLLEKSWDETWAFVRATTAFPVMFPPIELSRPAWHYLYQPLITPPPAAGGTIAVEARVLEPAWSDAKQDPLGEFRFVAADGGVLNNGPIELARRELAGLIGRNARDADTARRAVVHIDPLVAASTPNGAPQASLPATAAATLSSLISHARFSTQDFYLAAEPAGRSRFLITAVRTSNGRSLEGTQALASGSLGAFGGFLSAWYRHHDFMLGRRNCQQFLRRHFTLAAGNPSFCEHAAGGDSPIIPLIGSAAAEQVLPAWPAGRFDADQPGGEHGKTIRDAVKQRIAHVDQLALKLLGGRLKLVLFLVVPRFIASIVLTRSVVERISKSLKQHRLLR